jgi:hypothetical protein
VAARNPVADMKDVLQAVSPSNFPAISNSVLSAEMRATARKNELDAQVGARKITDLDARRFDVGFVTSKRPRNLFIQRLPNRIENAHVYEEKLRDVDE